MNQADLQTLATERIRDAEVLLQNGRWAYAYYTAGYAVECAIKACILSRMIHTGWIFQDKAKIDECRVHDLDKLTQLAGLTDELNLARKTSAAGNGLFVGYWGIVAQWQVTTRYQAKTEQEARDLHLAITNNPDGVLIWLQKYW